MEGVKALIDQALQLEREAEAERALDPLTAQRKMNEVDDASLCIASGDRSAEFAICSNSPDICLRVHGS